MTHRPRIARLATTVLIVVIAGVSACGKNSTNPTNPPVNPADVTITIVGMNGNMSFSPNPATVTVGQKVAWRNNGGSTHTATADGGAFDTGNIGNGGTSAAITMGTAGSFAYHCKIHSTMVGTLTVNP